MKTGKIDEKIQQSLLSGKNAQVLTAIETLKTKGNSLYIPILFDVLLTSDDAEVLAEVTDLLSTVKDKTAVNSFIRGIENKKYAAIHKTILSCCWQNGLDFSNFLPVFIEVILSSDWETAFEAFTVIDNFEFMPTLEITIASQTKIREAMPKASEQIQYFLNEILKKLEE